VFFFVIGWLGQWWRGQPDSAPVGAAVPVEGPGTTAITTRRAGTDAH
jgi:hypothetical protein